MEGSPFGLLTVRTAVQRVVTGEKTVAELSRELDIAPSVIRSWKRFAEAGATTAVQAHEDVVPASHLREAYAKIRDLERALGRKTMEVEILRAAQEVVKKRHRCGGRGVAAAGGAILPPPDDLTRGPRARGVGRAGREEARSRGAGPRSARQADRRRGA